MKKLLYALLVVSLLAAIPIVALANQGKPSMENLVAHGWDCPILGEYHCFNPVSVNSMNTSSIQVLVFELNGKFLGTEVLWREDLYLHGMQPCPADEILTPDDIGIPYYACHHYDTGH